MSFPFYTPDPPVYNFLPNQPPTVLEGDDFTFSLGFDANPIPINFTWSRDGQVISSGGRIATSVSTITITSTTRSDSGSYDIVSFNVVGSGKGFFTLDVQCELHASHVNGVCLCYYCPFLSSSPSSDHQQSQSNYSSPKRRLHLQLYIRICKPSCSELYLSERQSGCGWWPCNRPRASADHHIRAVRGWRELLLQCQQQCGERYCLQQPH